MQRPTRDRIVWYVTLLTSIVAGSATGALLAFFLLFSAAPNELGIPQGRQFFDLIVALSLCVGAAMGWVAAGIIWRIPSAWRRICSVTTPRGHRSFARWSLLTVAVVFACSLAWALNWQRQRHEYLEVQNEKVREFYREMLLPPHDNKPTSPPIWLWPLGEQGAYRLEIVALPQDRDAEVQRAMALFPESHLTIIIKASGEGH